MFAGENATGRTNQRFKFISAASEDKRLSTAFDSVTLYDTDPDSQLDIFGQLGISDVSAASRGGS